MFLVEDVRQASPSQLAARKAFLERRAVLFGSPDKSVNVASAPIDAARSPHEQMKFMVGQIVDNSIQPSASDMSELPVHVRGNAKSVVKVISKVCANKFNVEAAEIAKSKRTKQIVLARHVAFWLCMEVTKWSYPEVGRRMGGKDHTTVLHGIRKMRKRIGTEADFAAALETLKATVIDRMQAADSDHQSSVPGQRECRLSE